ncbi:hypothetical protein Sros01_72400 [Streptomyces roseochromogenus]|nr:hypothetical protein Sros01_72400 [Streptomyces roseochromogenus]
MDHIPLPRLSQIVEDHFARDPRTRGHKLQEARRLHTVATAAASVPAQVPSPEEPLRTVRREWSGPLHPRRTPPSSFRLPVKPDPYTAADPTIGALGAVTERARRACGVRSSAARRRRCGGSCGHSPDAGHSSFGAEWERPTARQLYALISLIDYEIPGGPVTASPPPPSWLHRMRTWHSGLRVEAKIGLWSLGVTVIALVVQILPDEVGKKDATPDARPSTSTAMPTSGASRPSASSSATSPSRSSTPRPATSAATPPEYAVTIEKPADESIPRCIDVSGQGQPAQGHQLWIGMRVDKEFFILRPVRQDSTAGAGRWSAEAVTVGSAEGTDAEYVIAVLDLTPDLSTTLTRLTVDGQPDNLWRIAFPSYPAGVVIKAEKPLRRHASEQADC